MSICAFSLSLYHQIHPPAQHGTRQSLGQPRSPVIFRLAALVILDGGRPSILADTQSGSIGTRHELPRHRIRV